MQLVAVNKGQLYACSPDRIVSGYETFQSRAQHVPVDSSEMTDLVQYMQQARTGALADLWDGVQVHLKSRNFSGNTPTNDVRMPC